MLRHATGGDADHAGRWCLHGQPCVRSAALGEVKQGPPKDGGDHKVLQPVGIEVEGESKGRVSNLRAYGNEDAYATDAGNGLRNGRKCS